MALIYHFTAVTRPLNGSDVAGDLVLIQLGESSCSYAN